VIGLRRLDLREGLTEQLKSAGTRKGLESS